MMQCNDCEDYSGFHLICMNTLRVLFIAFDPYMGGSSHSLLQLAKELRNQYGVSPLILMPTPRLKNRMTLAHKCEEEGIPFLMERFYGFKGKKDFKLYVKFFVNYVFFYPIILYKIRNTKIDIVHSNNSIIDIGVFISHFKKAKHIWHLRESGDADFGLYPVFGSVYERFIYKKGDCFIAISEFIRNKFSSIIPKEKIELIYNGVVAKPKELNSAHNNSQIKFVILGSVLPTKNQLEALEALAILKQEGYKFQLNIVGDTGDKKYLRILNKYIENKKLLDDVVFWRECNNVSQVLSAMDVGLMLSKNEAFGRVTVEYMLQNLLVIATNTGANSELVINGVTGYIYQIGSCNELAEKMKKCINNKDEMIRIAANGRKFAMQHFLSTENTKAVYGVYEKVLSDRNCFNLQNATCHV